MKTIGICLGITIWMIVLCLVISNKINKDLK